MNHLVYLGVGSNIDAEHHLRCGMAELARLFEIVDISSVVQSEAVGFTGNPFLNLVVATRTSLELSALHSQLRTIEYRYGRTEDCSKYSPRTLDIDILTYDGLSGTHHGIVLPRPETTMNAFVLGPFAEIAPDLLLPGETLTLQDLWARYDRSSQPLEPVRLEWGAGDVARDFKL